VYNDEVEAAMGYDHAVRRLAPHLASTYCNFPDGVPPPAQLRTQSQQLQMQHLNGSGGLGVSRSKGGMLGSQQMGNEPRVVDAWGGNPWDTDDVHVRFLFLLLHCPLLCNHGGIIYIALSPGVSMLLRQLLATQYTTLSPSCHATAS
jgi:hypothetical protein